VRGSDFIEEATRVSAEFTTLLISVASRMHATVSRHASDVALSVCFDLRAYNSATRCQSRHARTWYYLGREIPIVRSQVADSTGVLGAAALVLAPVD
jgi:hypothetical protein